MWGSSPWPLAPHGIRAEPTYQLLLPQQLQLLLPQELQLLLPGPTIQLLMLTAGPTIQPLLPQQQQQPPTSNVRSYNNFNFLSLFSIRIGFLT